VKPRLRLRLDQRLHPGCERVGMAHHPKVVRVDAVDGSLAIEAKQEISTDDVQSFHPLGLECLDGPFLRPGGSGRMPFVADVGLADKQDRHQGMLLPKG